ncbi:carbohydrate kinase family protein [Actinomadura rudentiformis]|uniref:Carbohydrate kinase family protein n=1 Tax=Actinomadura rudentiformis TaxID=359158 RepID=A0A6H9YIX6_9ACTN|nr:carbohydrate kinase family protein [Actinomadura rudentiformis]KAB2341112.1 carbohydrate kinase family protein [Actinomadura rudentiformis]
MIRPGTSRSTDVDVLLSGLLFHDLVFTGLDQPPKPGTEAWSTGMGAGPGGIANFAVTLARLGLRTALATAFGDDRSGRDCWDTLETEGVDLSPSRRFGGWTTPVTVSFAYDGDRALVSHGTAPPELRVTPPGARAAVLHIAQERVPWLERSDLGLVFADLGWDPSGEWSPDALGQLAHCHAFMPNAHEAMSYTRTDTPEAAVAKLAELVPLAVVTRGAGGAVAIDGSTGETASADGVPVAAVDPTGAGDVFGASLVAGTLAGWPLAHRLRFANLSAALSVRRPGGSLSAPGWAGITEWWRAVPADPELRRAYAFLDDVIPDVIPAAPAPVPGAPDIQAPATPSPEGSSRWNSHADD